MGQSEAHKKNKELVEAQNLYSDRKYYCSKIVKYFDLKLYILCRGNTFSTVDVILLSANNFVAHIATH